MTERLTAPFPFHRPPGPRSWPLALMSGALAVLVACGRGAGDEGPPSSAALTATCRALRGQSFGDVTVTDARRIEASSTNASGFCQVSASAAPFLDIEVDVPDDWSGRLWQQGGGGFDGRIPSAVTTDTAGAITAVSPALARKAAIYAASNGGNRAAIPWQAAPAVWADGTADGRASGDDYAYAAIWKTSRFARSMARAFFAKLPSHSYFNGCSNGGRNAYIAAQRWPEDYDGIVAGCETMDSAGQTAAWMSVGSLAATPSALTPAQARASWSAAVTACDALDGATDGVIGNPGACSFDPAALRCGAATASTDGALCLSDAQVALLHSMLSDLRLPDGSLVYARYSWADFSGSRAFGFLASGFALLATDDAGWLTPDRQALFDLGRDYYVLASGLSRRGADHDKVAIAAYVASGKKLISWHDGSDNLLSANDHLRNYGTMVGIAHSLGLADPDTSTRFFVVPGGSHAQGHALTEVDWASAIMDWVERGTAPVQLTYTFSTGTTTRTMPVCQHPRYPRFNGSGDVNSATSYTCT